MPLIMTCNKCGVEIPENGLTGGTVRFTMNGKEFRKKTYLCNEHKDQLSRVISRYIGGASGAIVSLTEEETVVDPQWPSLGTQRGS